MFTSVYINISITNVHQNRTYINLGSQYMLGGWRDVTDCKCTWWPREPYSTQYYYTYISMPSCQRWQPYYAPANFLRKQTNILKTQLLIIHVNLMVYSVSFPNLLHRRLELWGHVQVLTYLRIFNPLHRLSCLMLFPESLVHFSKTVFSVK